MHSYEKRWGEGLRRLRTNASPNAEGKDLFPVLSALTYNLKLTTQHYFVSTTAAPRLRPNARAALPLFTPISTNPLDPTYANGSVPLPCAKVSTKRLTACVPTCKLIAPPLRAPSGKSSCRKLVIKLPNASVRRTTPLTTPSASLGRGSVKRL